jgi:hypothetical protein
MSLTKSDIINGKNNITEVEFEELGGTIRLSPLTDGEINRINATIKGGGLGKIKANPVMKDGIVDKDATMKKLNMEIDIEQQENIKYHADCMAVAFSLNNNENKDTYTPEDVKKFPAGSVTKIALKVYEISGIDDPNTTRNKVENFRQKK